MQISTKAQEGQKLGPNLGFFFACHLILYNLQFCGTWATPRACKWGRRRCIGSQPPKALGGVVQQDHCWYYVQERQKSHQQEVQNDHEPPQLINELAKADNLTITNMINPPETGWFNIQPSQVLGVWIYNQLPLSDLMGLGKCSCQKITWTQTTITIQQFLSYCCRYLPPLMPCFMLRQWRFS